MCIVCVYVTEYRWPQSASIRMWAQLWWMEELDRLVPIEVRLPYNRQMHYNRQAFPSLCPNWTRCLDNLDRFLRHLWSFSQPVVVHPRYDAFRPMLAMLHCGPDWPIQRSRNIALRHSIATDAHGFGHAVNEKEKLFESLTEFIRQRWRRLTMYIIWWDNG